MTSPDSLNYDSSDVILCYVLIPSAFAVQSANLQSAPRSVFINSSDNHWSMLGNDAHGTAITSAGFCNNFNGFWKNLFASTSAPEAPPATPTHHAPLWGIQTLPQFLAKDQHDQDLSSWSHHAKLGIAALMTKNVPFPTSWLDDWCGKDCPWTITLSYTFFSYCCYMPS